MGNLCRFSEEEGIQAFNPFDGCKKFVDDPRPFRSAVRIEGMESMVIQYPDGSISLFGGEDVDFEELNLGLGEEKLKEDELWAAVRSRPGLLLLGFDSGRVLAIQWAGKKVIDDFDLDIGRIMEFQVSEGNRALAIGLDGAKLLKFDSPHDKVGSAVLQKQS